MDERVRRRWAASEAVALGWGGITAVAEATGLSPTTIRLGIAESRAPETDPSPHPNDPHVRRPGGGRKRLAEEDRTLVTDLETLVSPSTRGDPQSPLRWTCKSTRKLAEVLVDHGHRVSHQTVARLLQESGYNLQVNRKNREGDSHPDRDAQFEYIAKQVRSAQRRGQPVVSVDTKKKELIGDFRNVGVGNTNPRARRKRSAARTSRIRNWARSPLTASMTRQPTRVGSVWGLIMTRPSSPPIPCVVGGPTWASGFIPGRPTF